MKMNCWICGNKATTGEHKTKASDLRALAPAEAPQISCPRPTSMGFTLMLLEWLQKRACHPPTRNGRPMAPEGIQIVLEMEIEEGQTRATTH